MILLYNIYIICDYYYHRIGYPGNVETYKFTLPFINFYLTTNKETEKKCTDKLLNIIKQIKNTSVSKK